MEHRTHGDVSHRTFVPSSVDDDIEMDGGMKNYIRITGMLLNSTDVDPRGTHDGAERMERREGEVVGREGSCDRELRNTVKNQFGGARKALGEA